MLDELELAAGVIRENITVRGIGVNGMAPGLRIRLGDALIEVTKPCSPCSLMDEIRPGLKDELVGRRGTYARVVEPGLVRVGDPVTVEADVGTIP